MLGPVLGRYMAAVHAAAAEAAQESGGGKDGPESAAQSVQKAAQAPARERERLLERLRGVCEGGSVIPVPFLRAAHAVPPAILDDMRAPYVHPSHAHALLVSQPSWWTRLLPHHPSSWITSLSCNTTGLAQAVSLLFCWGGQECKCLSAGLAVGCKLAAGRQASIHEHHIMTMMHTAQVLILQVDPLLWDDAQWVYVW